MITRIEVSPKTTYNPVEVLHPRSQGWQPLVCPVPPETPLKENWFQHQLPPLRAPV